jgi:SPP1 family predicted phage head-tail adaptor
MRIANLRAGRLNKRVMLQRRRASADSEGSPVEGWTNVCKVWVQVEQQLTHEREQGGQLVAQVTHGVRMHYRRDVARAVPITGSGTGHHMRLLLDNGRVLDIRFVMEVDSPMLKQQLELDCIEHQA